MNKDVAYKLLTEPLNHTEIEWRVQSQTKDKTKVIVVPYITNRCVMNRFDEAFDPFGWASEIRPIPGGFICRLTVFGEPNVYHEDGASETGIEPIKGGISDSMKRAAVKFGLGRSLYDYPKVMIETLDKYIPNWAYSKLNDLVKWVNDGKCDRDLVILKEK